MTHTKLCIHCAYHAIPKGLRTSDDAHHCAKGARRDIVTGAPVDDDCKECYVQRARYGECGPAGKLFSGKLTDADFNSLFNPADLSVNGHGLDESSQKDGVFSSVSIAQNGVYLADGNTQVFADGTPRVNGSLVE